MRPGASGRDEARGVYRAPAAPVAAWRFPKPKLRKTREWIPMIAKHTLPKILALAALPADSLSNSGRALAAMSLFDWLVVAPARRSR
jgi:hypothetical protein